MPIVSSTHTVGHAQIDGRRQVIETHVDDLGVAHVASYLASVGTDYAAVRDARVATINASLAESEAQALIEAG